MITFVSGEGGTGKTSLINQMAEYAKLHYGKQKRIYRSVVKTAPTGSAAKLSGGFTWQAVHGKSKVKRKNSCNGYMAKNTAKAVGAKTSGLKLLVIDEISMINLETLAEISNRKIEAMLSQTDDENERNITRSKLFGGVHMLFTGDFYQLKPIHGEAMYTENPKNIKSLEIEGIKIWHSIKLAKKNEKDKNMSFSR